MFFQRKTYACKRKLSSPQNTLAFRCQASNLSRSGVQRSGVHPLPRLRPHHGLKKFENTAFISTVNPTVHTSPEELAVVVVKKKTKKNERRFLWKRIRCFCPHYPGGIWKRRFFSENEVSNVFHQHYPGNMKTQQSTVNLDSCLRKFTWSSFTKISRFQNVLSHTKSFVFVRD